MRWIAALLVMVLAVSVASAAGMNPVNPVKPPAGQATATEKWDKGMEKFNETKKKLEEVRNKVQEKKQEVFKAWKRHLNAWIEVAKGWIERVRERVEHLKIGNKEEILSKLQDAENRLNEIQQEINKSQNYEELKGKARGVRQVWMEVRVELRAAVHSYAVEKYNETLERLKEVRDRLEAAGADVTALDEKITEIEEAVDELQNCCSTQHEFYQKVREINAMFREAFQLVKELARTIQLGYHTGFVYAHVNGSFELSGNFSSVLIKGDGELNVPENVIVTKVDTNEMKVVAKGNFTATGSGNFRILAHGSGVLKLDGEGYYRVKKTPSEPVSEEIQFEGNETVTFGVVE